MPKTPHTFWVPQNPPRKIKRNPDGSTRNTVPQPVWTPEQLSDFSCLTGYTFPNVTGNGQKACLDTLVAAREANTHVPIFKVVLSISIPGPSWSQSLAWQYDDDDGWELARDWLTRKAPWDNAKHSEGERGHMRAGEVRIRVTLEPAFPAPTPPRL